MPDDNPDFFSPRQLIHWLRIAENRWPNVTISRSGNGTGNLCVYSDGEYRAVIELHNPVEMTDFDEPYE